MGVCVADAAGLRQAIAEQAGEAYADALCSVASAHLQADLTAAERLALMVYARERLLTGGLAGGAEPGQTRLQPAAWTLAVHCSQALGRPVEAVAMARQLLQHWPMASPVAVPSVPPRRQDLERKRSSDSASWLRQMVAEYAACQGAYSSYFQPPAPQAWADLLSHPDHAVGIERRCVLAHMRANRVPAPAVLARLVRLTDPRHTANAPIWQGLLASMRACQPGGAAAGPVQLLSEVAEAQLKAPMQIVDVGASSHGAGTEPYAGLARHINACVLGFEPDAQAFAELERLFPDKTHYRFLPHLVGDGASAVFHATAWSQTASLLPPHRAVLDRYLHLGELVQETARIPVNTVRLDDVVAPGGMDLLKIDVQGGEGRVFDGATQRLSECLMVWTEVEFIPLYVGQPLFAEIDQQLRRHGLQFLRFASMATRPLASWVGMSQEASQQVSQGAAGNRAVAPAPPGSQQLWADAIYVPSPERIATLDLAGAVKLALLAHHMAQAYDLCHAALLRVDALADTDSAARYLEACCAAA
jgi:FkbM family methyltransferase